MMDKKTQQEIEAIRKVRLTSRRRVYRESVMTPYRAEIEYIRSCGASYMEIQHWLRRYHHVNIRKRPSIWYRMKIWAANNPSNKTPLDTSLQIKLKQQLKTIQDQLKKKRSVRKKRIDCHKDAILQMVGDGYSFSDIQLWLRRTKRMCVARSTIHKKVKSWKRVD